jgi:hypothetical protein
MDRDTSTANTNPRDTFALKGNPIENFNKKKKRR